VERAVRYGNDRASLEPLRERLRAGRDSCTLFDMPSLVRHLEGSTHRCASARNGTLPRPDLKNLDVYLEVAENQQSDAVEVQRCPTTMACGSSSSRAAIDTAARRRLAADLARSARRWVNSGGVVRLACKAEQSTSTSVDPCPCDS